MDLQKQLQVLGLSWADKDDFGKIKKAFCQKMRRPSNIPREKIEYNLAFK